MYNAIIKDLKISFKKVTLLKKKENTNRIKELRRDTAIELIKLFNSDCETIFIDEVGYNL